MMLWRLLVGEGSGLDLLVLALHRDDHLGLRGVGLVSRRRLRTGAHGRVELPAGRGPGAGTPEGSGGRRRGRRRRGPLPVAQVERRGRGRDSPLEDAINLVLRLLKLDSMKIAAKV